MLTLRFPSAVIRRRLQVPQKCSDMDVMKLIWPRKLGILKAYEEKGSRGRGDRLLGPSAPSPTSGPPTPQASLGSRGKVAPKALR